MPERTGFFSDDDEEGQGASIDARESASNCSLKEKKMPLLSPRAACPSPLVGYLYLIAASLRASASWPWQWPPAVDRVKPGVKKIDLGDDLGGWLDAGAFRIQQQGGAARAR